MGRRICFLHVGTGKTGSSAIQYALTRAHETLLEEGYLYPDASENFERVLAGQPTGGNAGTIAKTLRAAGPDGALDLVRPYAEKPHHLVLSCEGFSNYAPALLAEFGSGLQALGYDTKCLVFFRPQAEMIVSSYLQQVKSNKLDLGVDLKNYVAQQLTPENIQKKWNWYARARKLEKAFGHQSVTVKWYQSTARLGPTGGVKATFSWLGLPSLDDSSVSDVPVVNPTPGREALVILQSANSHGLGGKKFADEFLSQAFRAGLLSSKVSLTGELLHQIDAATRQGNADLLERYCPDLAVSDELRPPAASGREEPIDRTKLRELTIIAEPLLVRRVRKRDAVLKLRASPKRFVRKILEGLVDGAETSDERRATN